MVIILSKQQTTKVLDQTVWMRRLICIFVNGITAYGLKKVLS